MIFELIYSIRSVIFAKNDLLQELLTFYLLRGEQC